MDGVQVIRSASAERLILEYSSPLSLDRLKSFQSLRRVGPHRPSPSRMNHSRRHCQCGPGFSWHRLLAVLSHEGAQLLQTKGDPNPNPLPRRLGLCCAD